MKHLKLFEDFDTDYFSTYYEEISAEQYNTWRESWLMGDKYLVWDDDKKSSGFFNKIQDLCKSIIGDVSFSAEFDRQYEYSDKDVLKVLIGRCEETDHILLIRPFDQGGIGFMVSIFAPNTQATDYTKAMGHFICEESDTNPFKGLEQLLRDKAKEGLFAKVPRIPRSYKSEPVLKDEDFTERGIDNQMRAQFYKENGRLVRDLPREESLKVLDEWVMKNK